MGAPHPSDCHCGWCLLDRVQVLESQVTSLQMGDPRGLEGSDKAGACAHADPVALAIARDGGVMLAGWCPCCGALYFDGKRWPRWVGWRAASR
jgi:hypothetical protein